VSFGKSLEKYVVGMCTVLVIVRNQPQWSYISNKVMNLGIAKTDFFLTSPANIRCSRKATHHEFLFVINPLKTEIKLCV
jgi:hypothetical protein